MTIKTKGKRRVKAKMRSRCGNTYDHVEAGSTGWLLARNPKGDYLVKWDGRMWPSSHPATDIKVLLHPQLGK